MRNISAALTKCQMRDSAAAVAYGKPPIKDVTRRLGWLNARAGERLQVCEKCQGLKPGQSLVKICVIEVVAVRREPLNALTYDVNYGRRETKREGFALHPEVMGDPQRFVAFFCRTHKDCTPVTEVTRIEFRYEGKR